MPSAHRPVGEPNRQSGDSRGGSSRTGAGGPSASIFSQRTCFRPRQLKASQDRIRFLAWAHWAGEITAALSTLQEMQEVSWRSRGEKSQGHVRVALFQWDVDGTYRHPGFDLCDNSSPRFLRDKPESWNEHSFGHSCAESRRRALLNSALKSVQPIWGRGSTLTGVLDPSRNCRLARPNRRQHLRRKLLFGRGLTDCPREC